MINYIESKAWNYVLLLFAVNIKDIFNDLLLGKPEHQTPPKSLLIPGKPPALIPPLAIPKKAPDKRTDLRQEKGKNQRWTEALT